MQRRRANSKPPGSERPDMRRLGSPVREHNGKPLLPSPVSSKQAITSGGPRHALRASVPKRWFDRYVLGNVRLLTRSKRYTVHLVRLGLLALLCFFIFRWKLRHDPAFKQSVDDYIDGYRLEYGRHPYARLDLSIHQRAALFAYEANAGRYPSRRLPPPALAKEISKFHITNPAIPSIEPSVYNSKTIVNTGQNRRYTSRQFQRLSHAQAAAIRPPQHGKIDLDNVMTFCAFENNRYVVDCLAVLAHDAALVQKSSNRPIPKGLTTQNLTHLYTLDESTPPNLSSLPKEQLLDVTGYLLTSAVNSNSYSLPTPLSFSMPKEYLELLDTNPACRHDQAPKIFHVFWTGPFTDKPYALALSFLYTQNLGLQYPIGSTDYPFCRPQLWFWLVPGNAASSIRPHPKAKARMMRSLAANVWASPLLHPRFKDVIQFHLWNTTEQLESVPELRGQWQKLPLFKSGDYVLADVQYGDVVKSSEIIQEETGISEEVDEEEQEKLEADPILGRVASSSSSAYDRLAVVLSDMARFVLGHRFGGIYLDADTLLLRDFEELWNFDGAFAYRWSRMQQFNTAISKINRGSALGSFIIKTALLNHLDFHPHSVWRFLKNEGLLELYLRLPDALFDPAWLNTEYFQRDRPPFPYFEAFSDFFQPPKQPNVIPTIENFFRGAFTYHYHNQMWTSFDEEQNWPNIPSAMSDPLRRIEKSGTKTVLGNQEKPVLSWGTTVKRAFEEFLRGERANQYGEKINWNEVSKPADESLEATEAELGQTEADEVVLHIVDDKRR